MATEDYAEDCEDDEKKRKKALRSSPLRREKNVNSNRAELPIHVVDSVY
jgi:hypothetical protein